MPQKNFSITDETHRRLKILAAERNQTIGLTIEHLLDLSDVVLDRGTLVFKGRNGYLEINLSTFIPEGEF
jgi:hypothetical protein